MTLRYKRKTEKVNAFQLTSESDREGPLWFVRAVLRDEIFINRTLHDGAVVAYGCTIKRKNFRQQAKNGDYIIIDSLGRISACDKAEFDRLYEAIS